MAVADVGADQNGTSMRAVELLLLLEIRQVLADGNLRNPETLGELCHGDRPALLQQRKDPAVPFGKTQVGFFVQFIHTNRLMSNFSCMQYRKNYPNTKACSKENHLSCSMPVFCDSLLKNGKTLLFLLAVPRATFAEVLRTALCFRGKTGSSLKTSSNVESAPTPRP